MLQQSVTLGTLYAVGVGPGAPDLLTLRAVRVLGGVDAVLAAASSLNDHSAALDTARPYLRPDAEIVRLDFPMTHRRDILREAWTHTAGQTLAVLETGRSAAFLTIGDPLVYSTFGYLLREIRKNVPNLPVEIVPGITSFQAAGARAGVVLCEGRETLRLLSGINDLQNLKNELGFADTAVIMKAYRNMPAIGEALRATGRDRNCILASRVERQGERVGRGLPPAGETPPYMSLILSPAPHDSVLTENVPDRRVDGRARPKKITSTPT
ncbi:MAG: precorrin-2 C(20)-methyltransferase [Desulfovibrio sp.]|jgi:precorrin-2/cobalt-factor-2 C20-methyltransferase|nr:precorrin-2 C(20)-methyltransferase [Desulfovibrio sp.]